MQGCMHVLMLAPVPAPVHTACTITRQSRTSHHGLAAQHARAAVGLWLSREAHRALGDLSTRLLDRPGPICWALRRT
eukprot:2569755-Rhodomonas_salina.1